MPIKKSTGIIFTGMLLLTASGAFVVGQEQAATQEREVKQANIPFSNPQSGEQMYKDYCAACHGPGGKGDGPTAAFLKTWPPDLTTLAQRNDGKYPEIKVKGTLLFGTSSHAHGTSDMPVWGPLFRAQDGDEGRKDADLRVTKLTQYVGSLQHK
jgi:mono/diheme cytochrome c family protein